MSSTTTAPVEAGTTYPLPTAPTWHQGDVELDQGTVRYQSDLGVVELGVSSAASASSFVACPAATLRPGRRRRQEDRGRVLAALRARCTA